MASAAHPSRASAEDAAYAAELAAWEADYIAHRHFTRYVDARDILTASFEGGITRVSWLLKNGADVNQQDKDGNTPLIMAAMGGRGDMMNWLIYEDGVNVNHQNKQGKTALMSLMGRGFYENDWDWVCDVTEMLLNEGIADP